MIAHLAHHHPGALSVWAGGTSWAMGMAADATTGNTGVGLLTNLGVAGLIVAAILYMLRRSDAHDGQRIRDLLDERAALKAERDALLAQLLDRKDPTE